MELRVLGPVEVLDDRGIHIELPGVKAQTVLASLLLANGQTVSDTHLSDMLWAWDPPTTMTAQIYTYVSRLRKRLGPHIELIRRPRGYQLISHGAELDLTTFERLARRGRDALTRGNLTQAAEDLRAGVSRYRGTVLGNVTEFLADAERPRLEELRLAAQEDLVEVELALGRHQRLVPELTALTTEHPTRERLRAHLMTALYRCDRQSDALSVFHAGRRILAEELGIDPGATLTGVHQAVLEGTLGLPDAGPTPAGPVRLGSTAARPVPAMLPPDVADFTGRRAELAQLERLVDSDGVGAGPRRALITGMAGVGKSALAVHRAHGLRDRFPDGQLYADLTDHDGSSRSPETVLTSFLHALGVEFATPKQDLLELIRLYRTHCAGARLLVVLDNAVSNAQIAPLLPNGPESAVIVTSRRHLLAASGRDTLALPVFDDLESMELLAALVGPERVAADVPSARAIVDSCAGLPLAVRIAGVRLAARPHWPLARLAGRLADQSTRLDELSFGELRVRETIRRSLREVSLRGRQVLSGLANFGTGVFPAEAAAWALGLPQATAEQLLEELVDIRLLETAGAGGSDRGGYRLHELVVLLVSAPGAGGVPSQRGALRTRVPQLLAG
ncbi:BTAD domain-containing putative transcriptional regulator [Kitasatospora sp. NPDC050463]|uniref:AfsR/SARP family transcriptional regulator n=1 Tax=Kitasatospora sp. NPDC050463 TaxID=3155786 RepID=UPI00340B7A4D